MLFRLCNTFCNTLKIYNKYCNTLRCCNSLKFTIPKYCNNLQYYCNTILLEPLLVYIHNRSPPSLSLLCTNPNFLEIKFEKYAQTGPQRDLSMVLTFSASPQLRSTSPIGYLSHTLWSSKVGREDLRTLLDSRVLH